MERDRNDKGQFTGSVTDEQVLDAVRTVAPEPATATEVGEELGVTRKAAWEHLTALHEDGRVERKKVGGRSVVWWLDDDRTTAGINPDDAFWSATPGSSETPTDAAKADEYLADVLSNE